MPTVDPAIAHLDWPICQCEIETCAGQCANEATIRIQFHALDHCNGPDDEELDEDGNRPQLLCDRCYQTLRRTIAEYVARLCRFGRPHCLGCGAPVVCVKHVIRQVQKL